MANNERIEGHNEKTAEKEIEYSYTSHIRKQRMISKRKSKMRESRLPTPPPDPWCLQNPQNQEKTSIRSFDEEDMFAYLSDIDIPLPEHQASACSSRHSANSMAPIANSYTNEAFEHLRRLYDLVEEILELRDRNSKLFKRVRNLERLKVLRNADLRLENAFKSDNQAAIDFCDEDTGFAETLLDAILSNCREPLLQRRNIRSSSSRRTRCKSLAPSQQSLEPLNLKNGLDIKKLTSENEIYKNTPKVSKWTRVKAAFTWERARTNDIVETADVTPTITKISSIGSSSLTTKYLKIPDVEVESSNGSRNDISIHLENQSLKEKVDKDEQINRRSRFFDDDVSSLQSKQVNDVKFTNEVYQGKLPAKVALDKNQTANSLTVLDKTAAESKSRKSISPLTITIPSHEEESRCMSSPESTSSVYSKRPSISGENTSQSRKILQELFTNKEIKQQLVGDEYTSLGSKLQRQNSKWNKVRRAFLWNPTFSVSPSPTKDISRQTFPQDETAEMYSSSSSVEDLEKTAALNFQAETQRDYRALREKFGSEFHRKLIEWERLKSLSPRVPDKSPTDIQPRLFNTRKSFLPEESLIPEFKKKLQDWKCNRKERRGSAPFIHRVNRRRLTDWQLWKSPKYDSKNVGSYNDSEARESIADNGRPQLFEDLQKIEAWKKANEANSHDKKQFPQSNSNQLRSTCKIDKSEFLPLEKVLLFYENNANKKRRELNICQLNKRFNPDSRANMNRTQDANHSDDIFQQSTGFHFLGSACDLLASESNAETLAITPTIMAIENNKRVLKDGTLKRSKSLNDMIEDKLIHPLSFIRSSNTLQSLNRLGDGLANIDFIDTLPVSDDSQKVEDTTDGTVLEDSDSEAMIIDIEDVIEETASPLERMQPYQTPVYSVAASETTSIAVPLGTVTSSCEQDTFFVDTGSLHGKSKIYSQRKDSSSKENLNNVLRGMTKMTKKDEDDLSEDNINTKRHTDWDTIDDEKSDCSLHLAETDEGYQISNKVKDTLNQPQHDLESKEILAVSSKKGKMVLNVKEEELNELSFTVAQSKLATCRYNQDLSTQEKDRDIENDEGFDASGSSRDKRDVRVTETKSNHEYEELNTDTNDPYYCILADTQKTKGGNNYAVSCLDCMNQASNNVKAYDKNDDIIGSKLQDDNIYYNLLTPSTEEQQKLIEKEIEEPRQCKIENPSDTLEEFEYCSKPTVQVARLTIVPSSDEGCYEKISINNEALDTFKIPIAGTGSAQKIRDLKQSVKCSVTKDSIENYVYRSNTKGDTTINEDAINIKKQTSTTRNVFIETKRIISSPFRREKDCATGKKKCNVAQDDHVSSTKSKNESKSSFSKIYQQEPFLRTAFSLPWPLRLSSKNRKLEETRIREDNEEERNVRKLGPEGYEITKNEKTSLNYDGTRFQSSQLKPRVQFWENRRSSVGVIEGKNKSKYYFEQKPYESSSLVQIAADKRQNEVTVTASSSSLKTEEKKRATSSPFTFDPHTPDLIHKLKILSNAVARKDGRSNTIAEELARESHSFSHRDRSRYHSVLDPQISRDYNSLHASQNCMEISDRPKEIKNIKKLHADDHSLKLQELSRNRNMKGATMMEEKSELRTNCQNECKMLNLTTSRPDRVKSASVGMINIDPDIFEQLIESDRRCESLPRTISQQQSLGLFSKLANRFRLARLIPGKDIQKRDMSTVSTLCRQSLLINIRNEFENC